MPLFVPTSLDVAPGVYLGETIAIPSFTQLLLREQRFRSQ